MTKYTHTPVEHSLALDDEGVVVVRTMTTVPELPEGLNCIKFADVLYPDHILYRTVDNQSLRTPAHRVGAIVKQIQGMHLRVIEDSLRKLNELGLAAYQEALAEQERVNQAGGDL